MKFSTGNRHKLQMPFNLPKVGTRRNKSSSNRLAAGVSSIGTALQRTERIKAQIGSRGRLITMSRTLSFGLIEADQLPSVPAIHAYDRPNKRIRQAGSNSSG